MIPSLQYLNGGSANHWGSSRRVMPSFASLVFARLPLDVHLQCKVNQYIEIKQHKHKDGQVILSVIPSQHPFVLTVQGSSSSSSLCWEGGLPKSGLVDIAIAKRLALVPKSGFNKAPLQTQNKILTSQMPHKDFIQQFVSNSFIKLDLVDSWKWGVSALRAEGVPALLGASCWP